MTGEELCRLALERASHEGHGQFAQLRAACRLIALILDVLSHEQRAEIERRLMHGYGSRGLGLRFERLVMGDDPATKKEEPT